MLLALEIFPKPSWKMLPLGAGTTESLTGLKFRLLNLHARNTVKLLLHRNPQRMLMDSNNVSQVNHRGVKITGNGPLAITNLSSKLLSHISAVKPSSNAKSNRRTSNVVRYLSSSNARCFPAQFAGPVEKGMYADIS